MCDCSFDGFIRRWPLALRTIFAASIALFVPAVLPAADEFPAIEAIHDRPAALTSATGPVICLLDTEHPEVVAADLAKKGAEQYKNRLFRKDLQRLAGVPCILLHYTQATRKEIAHPQLKALVITARAKTLSKQQDDELFAIIREVQVPTLGICGGHQLIAMAYGGKYSPMRKLKPGEADPRPQYHPGLFKEWGFMNVNVVRQDPLFAGFGERLMIREFHAFEVTTLPAEFDVLASTAECRVEAMRHKEKPLYGTQFHPERYDAEHRDGEVLLKNFLRLAGLPKSDG